MSTYTYASTDLISGAVLADDIPLNVQSFSAQLNGNGTLTGQLVLSEDYAVNAPYVAALEPRRSVLWVLQDGYPIWAGIVWDWPDNGRSAGTLSINAQTFDSLWARRRITDTLEYRQVDIFQVFVDLVLYGLTKNSDYIATGVSPAATRPAGYLSAVESNGGVARLVLPAGSSTTAGVTWTASYTWSDLTQISSAWQDMCSSGNLEYCFVPGLDNSGDLAVFLRLGYLQLGREAQQAGYNLVYPGGVIDYAFQRTGSQSSNYVWATAPPNGSAQQWESVYPYGADLGDLAAGYPLLEDTASWQGSIVTSQSQINTWAMGQVQMKTQAMTLPTITLGGSGYPKLRDITLGDATTFTATSALHPPKDDGSPGLQMPLRVVGWSCQPPGPQQSEQIQLTTSGVVVA